MSMESGEMQGDDGMTLVGKLGWGGVGLVAIATATLLGGTLGSISLTTSTTLSVVTGMGAILGLSWIANQIMKWIEQHQPDHWHAIALRVAFIRGAINFAVVTVLILLTLWRVLWPTQAWPLINLGLGIGLIGALCGGLIATTVVARDAQNHQGG